MLVYAVSGIKAGLTGVRCHIAGGRVQNRSPISRPLVHCDNKTRHIGLNHDYNMTFLIPTREC